MSSPIIYVSPIEPFPVHNYVWDVASMMWVVETQPSGGGGGGAVTIADGADVAEGATTDAAITSDVNGTVSGKLRGLVKIFADVWDAANHWFRVRSSNELADRGAFVGGTTPVGLIGGVFDDTPPTALSPGMAAVLRLTNQRAAHVALRTDQNNPAGWGSLADLKIYSAVKGGSSGIINGNGQTGFSVSFAADSSSMGTILVTITGTWVGTIQFESPTGVPFPGVNLATGVPVTTTTGNGSFMFPIVGNQTFRVISTAWTSGAATVEGQGATQVGTVNLGTALPPGGNVLGHVILDASGAVIGHVIVDSGSLSVSNMIPAVETGLAKAATQTDGTQKSIVRGGAKGTTTTADVTSTAQSADRQGLDVQIRTSAGAAVDTFGGGIQFADGAARGTATGTLAMVDDGANIQSAKGDTDGTVQTNLTKILGTAPTTAGKLDVKAADGDAFVRQTTAANLQMTATQGIAAAGTASWPVKHGNLAQANILFNSASPTFLNVPTLGMASAAVAVTPVIGLDLIHLAFQVSVDGATSFVTRAYRADDSTIGSSFSLLDADNAIYYVPFPAGVTQFTVAVSGTFTDAHSVDVTIALSASVLDFGGTVPAGSGGTTDVTDRAARLLGHVIVDTLPSGTADVVQGEGEAIDYVAGTSRNLTQDEHGRLRVVPNNRELAGLIAEMTREVHELKTVVQFAHGINL